MRLARKRRRRESKRGADTGGEFPWSARASAYAASAAKANRGVVARGVPSNHAATRTRLTAVAVSLAFPQDPNGDGHIISFPAQIICEVTYA
jgi:hypothetical protein